ncbi:hypothetical protein U6A24_07925 [Aquimarina gracilis]|uniref:Uncharacterized protein n=1 Tax=Aquimarina gracilis TaxID=874422 RepID=A0ABU5ZUB0_9FLAO|nr:hypothetical protein [Aquimarina gracilis]MEB3345381.1 hypothetical protein [Aquimarina gracilis]
METNIKLPSKAIQVRNDGAMLTFKINKARFANVLRILGLAIFFLTYITIVFISYTAKSEMFPELLKAGFILGLVSFIVFHPKNNFKSKSE